MKVSVAALVFVLSMACLSWGMMSDSCFSYTSRQIPRRIVTAYFVTSRMCSQPAVVCWPWRFLKAHLMQQSLDGVLWPVRGWRSEEVIKVSLAGILLRSSAAVNQRSSIVFTNGLYSLAEKVLT
uniref:Chemokine interleukin-8-like domain-containing protein n=1 Tax=Chrysemys picta bellii TaxID=8478 RepID=A0A8C3FJI4_CHRPI